MTKKEKTKTQRLESEMVVDFTRQRDFFNPAESDHSVCIVGCGGIGSPTAVFLSKLGIPYLTLIDDDTIEPHNLPNQFFPIKMVGRPKVTVLQAVCDLFGTSDVTPIIKKVQDVPQLLNGTVVTGLDSMEARESVWSLVKDNKNVDYLVDARIGGMEIVIWTVDVHDKDQQEAYEEWAMFSDEEGEEAPCTARGIIDVGTLVAGLVTSQVRRIATKQKDIPLMISFSVGALELWTTGSGTGTETTTSSTGTSTGSTKSETTSISQHPEVTSSTTSLTPEEALEEMPLL